MGNCKYIGQVISGTKKPFGKGICIYDHGGIHEGHFKDGMRHGSGRLILVNGAVEEGEYKDGWMHGHSVENYARGTKKEGKRANGSK